MLEGMNILAKNLRGEVVQIWCEKNENIFYIKDVILQEYYNRKELFVQNISVFYKSEELDDNMILEEVFKENEEENEEKYLDFFIDGVFIDSLLLELYETYKNKEDEKDEKEEIIVPFESENGNFYVYFLKKMGETFSFESHIFHLSWDCRFFLKDLIGEGVYKGNDLDYCNGKFPSNILLENLTNFEFYEGDLL